MSPIPVTLLAAAAAALVNIWLGWRIAEYRKQFQVSVGHGGKERLLRRMRAQSNFIENAPIFLILLGALEISGANRPVLGLLRSFSPSPEFRTPLEWIGWKIAAGGCWA